MPRVLVSGPTGPLFPKLTLELRCRWSSSSDRDRPGAIILISMMSSPSDDALVFFFRFLFLDFLLFVDLLTEAYKTETLPQDENELLEEKGDGDPIGTDGQQTASFVRVMEALECDQFTKQYMLIIIL